MAHEISWYVPQRVMLHQYYGTFQYEDLDQIAGISQSFHSAKPGLTVHHILDMSSLQRFNLSLNDIYNLTLPLTDYSTVWVTMIGSKNRQIDHLTNGIGMMLSQSVNFQMVRDMEQAHLFLRRADTSLYDLLPFYEFA